MRKAPNLIVLMLVLITAAISVAAQERNPPDSQTSATYAKAILIRVVETHKSLRSSHFEGRWTWENVVESMGLKSETKDEELFVYAVIHPGRYRIESKNTNFSVTYVSDGKAKWVYAPGPNEYAKGEDVPAKPFTERHSDDPARYLGRPAALVAEFSRVADRVGDAKIIGEEMLEVEGQLIDCLVIEARYADVPAHNQRSRKLWIDKSRNIILREIRQSRYQAPWGKIIYSNTTIALTVARIGAQVPETLFAFFPPEGAKEVTEDRLKAR